MAALPLHADEAAESASSGVLSLSGADWRIHDDPDGNGAEQCLFETDVSTPGWIPATVPGNIQADLEAAHLLKPLWYGAGDPRLADAARKNWYRTDLFIENGECSIPPGQSRTITIRSDVRRDGGLSLAQTGWRVSYWNAGDAIVEPDDTVLLALGRRDAMCRGYLGYFDPKKVKGGGRIGNDRGESTRYGQTAFSAR